VLAGGGGGAAFFTAAFFAGVFFATAFLGAFFSLGCALDGFATFTGGEPSSSSFSRPRFLGDCGARFFDMFGLGGLGDRTWAISSWSGFEAVVPLIGFEAAVSSTEAGAVVSVTAVEKAVASADVDVVAPLIEIGAVIAFSVMGVAVLVGGSREF